MAIDPSIINELQTARVANEQVRTQQKQQASNQALQSAEIQNYRAEADARMAAARKAAGTGGDADQALLQEILQETGGDISLIPGALAKRGHFKEAMDVLKGWDEHVKATTPPPQAPARPVAVQTVDEQGQPVTKFVEPTAGASYPTQPKTPTADSLPASAKEYEYAKAQGYKGTFEQYQNEDANRHRSVTNISAGGNGTSDIKEAVRGMKDGSIPPQLPGRASKDYTAIMAEAHRQGYDLAGAATDWTATQKHIASMNGAQQLRLNQAINQLPDLLDSVDALAAKWKGGRFPILNRANLTLAKNGAYGQDVASVAVQLDAQIADVTADLGNVYMGGNSPTDHALGLASKALSADWDQKVLKDMTALARRNVQTRKNSINNTGVAGASADNPYAPPTATSAPVEKWVRDKSGKLVKQ